MVAFMTHKEVKDVKTRYDIWASSKEVVVKDTEYSEEVHRKILEDVHRGYH